MDLFARVLRTFWATAFLIDQIIYLQCRIHWGGGGGGRGGAIWCLAIISTWTGFATSAIFSFFLTLFLKQVFYAQIGPKTNPIYGARVLWIGSLFTWLASLVWWLWSLLKHCRAEKKIYNWAVSTHFRTLTCSLDTSWYAFWYSSQAFWSID